MRGLKQSGIESIAVCLLFSFLHPQHEARVREIIAEEMPGCAISLSSDVLPQIREYSRLSTTVINAYLQPILARYIAQLDRRLGEAGVATRQKYVMQSNGGMATFDGAATRAVTTCCPARPAASPPAPGCRMTGVQNLITFDMGGTSCDVALIKGGGPALASRGKIDGRDLARADDGHQHRQRRRRHHRARRPARRAEGRSAQRRRDARAQPATAAAAPSRRSPTATWCSATSAPTISSAAACSSTWRKRAQRSSALPSRSA